MYVEVAEVNQVPPSEKELIFVCWGGGGLTCQFLQLWFTCLLIGVLNRFDDLFEGFPIDIAE